MFTIAGLVKVRHDLWPWSTFRGHFEVTNVKIAYIFMTMRDKHSLLCLLWNTIGKLISDFQNPQNKLTSGDLDWVISRSRKWKWPISSKRLLLGPCLWAKMFTFAQLVKVHLDLWPWLTFRGHFKVTNVKIANIFLMVRDKHGVTMKH